MKQNTSFSSLPTGAHLHFAEAGEVKFVFVNLDKNETMERAEVGFQDVQKEFTLQRTKLEQQNLSEGIVSRRVLELSDEMRAKATEIAEQKVEMEFRRLDKLYEQKLVEVYGSRAKSTDANAIKTWLQQQVIGINSDVNIRPPEKIKKIEALMEPFIREAEKIENNDNWIQKGWKALGKGLGAAKDATIGSDIDWKTRGNNALGLGITSMYVVGIFAGAKRGAMWWTGGIAAASASLLPEGTRWTLFAADKALEGVGTGVNWTFTHIKNGLVGLARTDVHQMWSGQTEINEKRTEVMEGMYGKNIMKPQLRRTLENGEKGEFLVTDSLHAKIQNPAKVETLTDDEYKERSEGAAQFCVEMMDPSLLLTQEDVTPAQMEKLKNLDRYSEWDSETRELIKRTFATKEAVIMWNYFMLSADKEKELVPFANAFGKGLERKQIIEYGMTEKQIKAELQRKLNEMYPNITIDLMEKTPEGIASFMKEGGIEDLLIAVSIFMAGVYGVVAIGAGAKAIREKWNDRNNETKESRYLNKRTKAKKNLQNILNRPNVGKKEWKDALKYLFRMGVIHEGEQKELGKLKKTGTISEPGWTGIIAKMKANQFGTEANVGSNEISVTKQLQEKFWACVGNNNLTKKKRAEIGEINAENKIERQKAVGRLKEFKKVREEYQAFLKENQAYSREHSLWQIHIGIANKGRKTKEVWKRFNEWRKVKGKQSKQIDSSIFKKYAENRTIYADLKILGIHQNQVDLLKSISKKKGARKIAIYTKVDEMLGIPLKGTSS
jgi:hypothetical protein